MTTAKGLIDNSVARLPVSSSIATNGSGMCINWLRFESIGSLLLAHSLLVESWNVSP